MDCAVLSLMFIIACSFSVTVSKQTVARNAIKYYSHLGPCRRLRHSNPSDLIRNGNIGYSGSFLVNSIGINIGPRPYRGTVISRETDPTGAGDAVIAGAGTTGAIGTTEVPPFPSPPGPTTEITSVYGSTADKDSRIISDGYITDLGYISVDRGLGEYIGNSAYIRASAEGYIGADRYIETSGVKGGSVYLDADGYIDIRYKGRGAGREIIGGTSGYIYGTDGSIRKSSANSGIIYGGEGIYGAAYGGRLGGETLYGFDVIRSGGFGRIEPSSIGVRGGSISGTESGSNSVEIRGRNSMVGDEEQLPPFGLPGAQFDSPLSHHNP